MLDAVFFDLGRVLLDFDLEIAYRRASERSSANLQEIKAAVLAPRMTAFERGEISTNEFLGEIAAAIEFGGEVEELRMMFNDIFSEMHDNLEAARKLKGRVRLGLISNTNESHIEFAESRYDLFTLFDVRVYSHKEGIRKPEQEIYRRAMDRLGVRPDRSLFIDDLAANVEGAVRAGMHAVRLAPGVRLTSDLHPLLRALL